MSAAAAATATSGFAPSTRGTGHLSPPIKEGRTAKRRKAEKRRKKRRYKSHNSAKQTCRRGSQEQRKCLPLRLCVCVCLFDCLIVFSESGGQSGGADLQEQNNKTKRCDSCSSSCGTGGCNPWHHVFLCFFLLLPFFFYKRSAAYGTVGASFGSLSFFKLLLFYRYLGCSSHMTRLPHGRF
jgi:hypothetical protein